MLEKVAKEFHFTIIENGGFSSGNLLVFPKTEEWAEKNQKIQSLALNLSSKKTLSTPEQSKRATLVKENLL
jgi:hypothetical protein